LLHTPEISVVLPTWNEDENLKSLLPEIRRVLDSTGNSYELVVIDKESHGETAAICRGNGAVFEQQREAGYGGALRQGLARARGAYIFTLDADWSHPPDLFLDMWKRRHPGRTVIASRYIAGGSSGGGFYRRFLSIV
jgi:dolichol-phosphate mannosyltransferase